MAENVPPKDETPELLYELAERAEEAARAEEKVESIVTDVRESDTTDDWLHDYVDESRVRPYGYGTIHAPRKSIAKPRPWRRNVS
jgi:hypothetical protein